MGWFSAPKKKSARKLPKWPKGLKKRVNKKKAKMAFEKKKAERLKEIEAARKFVNK